MSTISVTTPFLASVTNKRRLTRPTSDKTTYHIELDIAGSDMQYQVGDAIGVLPKNSKNLIDQIIAWGGFSKYADVQDRKGNVQTVEELFTTGVDLQRASPKLIRFAAKITTDLELQKKLLAVTSHDLITVLDLLQKCDFKQIEEQQFVSMLKPLTPRFYSIASAQEVVGDQIDLIVTVSEYTSLFGSKVRGLCSDYLCNFIDPSEKVSIYLHPAKNFALPKEDKPIIMIGPGTGIAPFRGFLQLQAQRKHRDNWLFFGERKQQEDFYYQEELLDWEHQGFVKITTAFSRDQEHKIYVQDRILEEKEQIWKWLEKGAVVFVCGDAKNMAKSVEQTFLQIFEDNGKDPKLFLKELRQQGRYLQDVY